QTQRKPTDVQDVLQQKARADEDDTKLEPELVCGDAGTEHARDADSIRDQQAKQDGPEDIFNARYVDAEPGVQIPGAVLEKLAQDTDSEEQRHARQHRKK